MEAMEASWWEQLILLEKIFWGFAIPSTLIFIIILISTFIGGSDADMDAGSADADIDGDAGIGFQFFTLKNLVGFFTIFSWTGIACLDSGMTETASMIISVIAGLFMMVAMASLFYFMGKLTDDGTLRMKNAVGKTGDVYLLIPANRSGFGKVNIMVQGAMRELRAMTDENFELSQGTIVVVQEVIDENILLVSKSK